MYPSFDNAMSDEEGFDEIILEFGVGKKKSRVESNRETVSISSSNERIKETPIDRLSELPNSLLIHILSFLGVKKAGVTSVLSKRWKFLWAKLPTLEFREWGSKLDFVPWVNRALDIRKGCYLEKFLVSFNYYNNKCPASDVDAWIEFSVKNEVKELSLILETYMNNYYVLPQVIYSCSSLIALHISGGGCIMSYERTIEWQSLTDLTLSNVMLNQHLLDEILSSCTVLKSLALDECWGFNHVVVNSRCLKSLTFEESENEQCLEISAPYICSLNIVVFPRERKWQLRNISSVVTAYIDFVELYDYSLEVMGKVKEFLENFKHVGDLEVRRPCFEFLSIMAVNGWQLPQFKLRNLTIVSCSEYEHVIPGIMCLLESSPNLETLVLEGYETEGEIVTLDPTVKGDLENDLLHLRTIKVENFADQNGEPLLTLVRILLRRAPALEQMLIVIDVEDTSDFVKIGRTLHTYSRSSTKAIIHLFCRK